MGFGKKKKDKAEQAIEQAVEVKAYGGVLPEKVYDYLLVVFCLAMCIMHMICAKKSFLQQEVYLTMHMFFSFIILFLSTAKKSESKIHNAFLFLSVALTFAFTIYVCCNLEALRVRQWVSTNLDIVVGCTMIVLALYACWLGFGKFIPILVIIVCIYPFFRKDDARPLSHKCPSLQQDNLQPVYRTDHRAVRQYADHIGELYLFILCLRGCNVSHRSAEVFRRVWKMDCGTLPLRKRSD